MTRHPLIVIAVLSVAGTLLATYSLLNNQGLASGEFCIIGDTFNCDIVNKGPYSRILGVPVAAIGIAGYLLICASALLALKNQTDRGLKVFLVLAAAGGLAFSLYLTSLEAFVLHTWCLLCLGSQAIILTVFVLSVVVLRFEFRQKSVINNSESSNAV